MDKQEEKPTSLYELKMLINCDKQSSYQIIISNTW